MESYDRTMNERRFLSILLNIPPKYFNYIDCRTCTSIWNSLLCKSTHQTTKIARFEENHQALTCDWICNARMLFSFLIHFPLRRNASIRHQVTLYFYVTEFSFFRNVTKQSIKSFVNSYPLPTDAG